MQQRLLALIPLGLLIAACAVGGGVPSGATSSGQAAQPDDDVTSYAIGFDLGSQTLASLQEDSVSFERDRLVAGFVDAVSGKDATVDPVDMRAALAKLEREVSTRLAEQRLANDPLFEALARQNAAQSKATLDRFAQRPGARELPGGSVYIPHKQGSGRSPGANDIVEVRFIARGLQGQILDDSASREIRVSGMIGGAELAIQQMRVGDRWEIAIPPEHAFGIGGLLPDIGPNELITIDVELIGIR